MEESLDLFDVDRVGAENDEALAEALKLAYVAGPGVRLEALENGGLDASTADQLQLSAPGCGRN